MALTLFLPHEEPLAETFETQLAACAAKVEEKLHSLLPVTTGNRLQEAMRYAALGQGKRLRPFFVLESAKLHGIPESRALNEAAALELIHC